MTQKSLHRRYDASDTFIPAKYIFLCVYTLFIKDTVALVESPLQFIPWMPNVLLSLRH